MPEVIGDTTTVSKASSQGSLRTVVPVGIARQMGISEGSRLRWLLQVVEGKMKIVVEPEADDATGEPELGGWVGLLDDECDLEGGED